VLRCSHAHIADLSAAAICPTSLRGHLPVAAAAVPGTGWRCER